MLDLRGVEFMDSTGLRAIVVAALRRRARRRQPRPRARAPEPVMRVFDMTRMRERLTFVDPPEPAA